MPRRARQAVGSITGYVSVPKYSDLWSKNAESPLWLRKSGRSRAEAKLIVSQVLIDQDC